MSQSGFLILATQTPLLERLLFVDALVKPLSGVYKEMFPIRPLSVEHCREKWVVDVPDLKGNI